MRFLDFFRRSESLTKVNHVIEPKTSDKDILVDQIIGTQKIVFKNTVIYNFKNGIVDSCLNISEFYDEEAQEINVGIMKKFHTKNLKVSGNTLTYEWDDEFFEQKGKGATPYQIKKYLKDSKYKVKVIYKKRSKEV